MITKIFISLSLIISFQAYAGPFDDLKKGLGAIKELESMVKKDEKDEEKDEEGALDQVDTPVIEDPVVAEEKRKEEEARKEKERLALEEQRKKEAQEREQKRIADQKRQEEQRIARQKEQKRAEIMNYVAAITAADRCRDEYQINENTKNMLKEYLRNEVSKAIDDGTVTKNWVNNNLKQWRVMVAQQSLVELYQFCQNLESIAAAIKAETQEDEDSF